MRRRQGLKCSLFVKCFLQNVIIELELCSQVNKDDTLHVMNSGRDTETEQVVNITGTLELSNENLYMQFDGSLPNEEYIILETDYIDFASVWNCREFVMMGILVRREFGWILTRKSEPFSQVLLDKVLRSYQGYGIDTEQFDFSSFTKC